MGTDHAASSQKGAIKRCKASACVGRRAKWLALSKPRITHDEPKQCWAAEMQQHGTLHRRRLRHGGYIHETESLADANINCFALYLG